MTDVIGYRKTGKDTWDPIIDYRGGVATAALLCCGECHIVIKSSGGPGHNCLCPSCYETRKMLDFSNGIKHV